MSGDDAAIPPPVLWAQRPNAVLLTICLEDCKNPIVEIKPDSIHFEGVGGVDKKPHKITIQLYKEIDPENSLHVVQDRLIEFGLKKKEEGPFWPRLTKDKVKYHWLKVDFDKWKDEDDTDDEANDFNQNDDLERMMKEMGGLQDGDNPLKANMDDLNVDSEDSDDGDLPDLE